MRTTRLGGLVAETFKERYTEISLLSEKQTSLVSYEKECHHPPWWAGRLPTTVWTGQQDLVIIGPALRPGAIAQSPGREAALAWATLSQRFGKDSEAGRDWGQEEKGTTEDEMAGWHH